VAREVEGEHAPAMMGERACLHGEDRVIHAGAVHEDDGGLVPVVVTATGPGKDGLAVERKLHLSITPPRA
jgi:hypothetical protein